MSFLVIDKNCANKIFTVDDPEIEFYEFKTREEAEYYIRYGIKKKIDVNDTIKVFTDGSCSMNGRKGAKAGIGIYFSEDDERNVSKRINGKQTTNTAELSAIIEVFHILKDEIELGKQITIYTDSEYVIRCCTRYGEKCHTSNWNNHNSFLIY